MVVVCLAVEPLSARLYARSPGASTIPRAAAAPTTPDPGRWPPIDCARVQGPSWRPLTVCVGFLNPRPLGPGAAPLVSSRAMPALSDKSLRPIFQPDGGDAPVRALVVAGACGNVGFGKLGQFARLMSKHGVPVVALDLSDKVQQSKDALRKAYGDHFEAKVVDQILQGVTVVQGGISDLPGDLSVGFVFEAIPERLDIKHAFYREIRARDPEAYIFSATSGFPSTVLFDGLDGADRCGVMHPFFPHLTNKLWEVPTRGASTSAETMKVMAKFLGGQGMSTIQVADVPAFAADRIFSTLR